MKPAFLLLLCLVSGAQASLLESRDPVTLDTAEMARAWQAVSQGKPRTAAAQDAWQAAMLEQDAELSRIYLLLWLQEHNPLAPVAQHAHAYAEAVGLHRAGLAGQAQACAALAAAYRSGTLGSLSLPPSEEKARWFEQRALVAENLPQ